MRGALGGPRVLLRRLREVMAEPVSAQDRLDKIVVLIAANMVAEVCSVYVLRVDGTLELYATEGLNRKAVHLTVMRADEGLVGLVSREAKSINLSDAQAHPSFSYRPETGEEIYHSFLGVPILRADRLRHDLAKPTQQYARTAKRTPHGVKSSSRLAVESPAGRTRPTTRHTFELLQVFYARPSTRMGAIAQNLPAASGARPGRAAPPGSGSFRGFRPPAASYRSRPYSECSVRTAWSVWLALISTENFISEVVIARILIFSPDSALKASAATPAWLRMPMPMTETLATSVEPSIWS